MKKSSGYRLLARGFCFFSSKADTLNFFDFESRIAKKEGTTRDVISPNQPGERLAAGWFYLVFKVFSMNSSIF